MRKLLFALVAVLAVSLSPGATASGLATAAGDPEVKKKEEENVSGKDVIFCMMGVVSFGQNPSECADRVKKFCKLKMTRTGPQVIASGGASVGACAFFLLN